MAKVLKRKSNEVFDVENEAISMTNGEVLNENGETPEYDLEAGYIDENGVCHNTYTLREINGADEEAVSKGDVRSNGSKLVNVLLSRCCLSIGTIKKKDVGIKKWESIIKSLLVGDQDIMLIKLREISIGKEFEVVHKCPSCGTELRTYFSSDELELIPFSGEREIPFELPSGYKDSRGIVHKLGTMRLSTGLDREILTPLATKNAGKAKTAMLVRLCKFEDGLIVTDDVMKRLVLRDREYLQKLLSDNLFGIEMTVDVECTNCGEEFKGNLNNVTNFI